MKCWSIFFFLSEKPHEIPQLFSEFLSSNLCPFFPAVLVVTLADGVAVNVWRGLRSLITGPMMKQLSHGKQYSAIMCDDQ